MSEKSGYDLQIACLKEIREEVCNAIYNVNVGSLKRANLIETST